MKRWVSIFVLIVVALPLYPWVSIAFSAQASENRAQASKDLPDTLLYEMYFRRIAYFENLANKPDLPDLSRIRVRAVIKEELVINEDQKNIFSQISRQALQEASFLDEKAKEIISRERARYPGGEVRDRDQVPKVPAELTALQQARDSIFINAKTQLLNQLGPTVFDDITLRIKSIILPNVKVVDRK